MKLLIVAVLLWTSMQAQTASIKITSIEPAIPRSALSGSISFFCTADYDSSQCLSSATALAHLLERYPTAKLGDWRFVLAGSKYWKQTVKSLGGDTESPAFTELDARVTVLQDTLFDEASSQKMLLSQRFGLQSAGMLDFAVTHELGHAICHERNEHFADQYGLDLRKGMTPLCGTGR
jgi:hypothetical protein